MARASGAPPFGAWGPWVALPRAVLGVLVALLKGTMRVSVQELQQLHAAFDADVESVWSFESSVDKRSAEGGTSRSSVLHQIAKLKEWLATSATPHAASVPTAAAP